MNTTEYAQLKAEKKAMLEKIREQGKAYFLKEAQELFNQHPEMTSFAFKAYTVYFNDGDECHYCVYADEPDINNIDGGDITEAWTNTNYKGEKTEYPANYPELIPAQKAVSQFINQFDYEDIKAFFGDHIAITVTKDGVTIDDYSDHD